MELDGHTYSKSPSKLRICVHLNALLDNGDSPTLFRLCRLNNMLIIQHRSIALEFLQTADPQGSLLEEWWIWTGFPI